MKKVAGSPNLKDRLAVFRQDRVIIPEQNIKQLRKHTKSAPDINV